MFEMSSFMVFWRKRYTWCSLLAMLLPDFLNMSASFRSLFMASNRLLEPGLKASPLSCSIWVFNLPQLIPPYLFIEKVLSLPSSYCMLMTLFLQEIIHHFSLSSYTILVKFLNLKIWALWVTFLAYRCPDLLRVSLSLKPNMLLTSLLSTTWFTVAPVKLLVSLMLDSLLHVDNPSLMFMLIAVLLEHCITLHSPDLISLLLSTRSVNLWMHPQISTSLQLNVSCVTLGALLIMVYFTH